MHSLAEDLSVPGRGFVPADRVARLGTETVFAVSAEAAALAAEGRTIYPFHLGDLNIPTAEPIVEAMMRAIRDGKTTYCANAGVAPLREALATDVGAARGVTYGADDVSVQPGGKPVIGKWLMAAMNAGRRGPLPQPRLPHLQLLHRVRRGCRRAVRVRGRGRPLRHRHRRHRAAHHAAHAPAHPQRPAQPHGRRVHVPRSSTASPRSRSSTTCSCSATRRTSTCASRVRASRSSRARACGSAPSSCTRSARSTR